MKPRSYSRLLQIALCSSRDAANRSSRNPRRVVAYGYERLDLAKAEHEEIVTDIVIGERLLESLGLRRFQPIADSPGCSWENLFKTKLKLWPPFSGKCINRKRLKRQRMDNWISRREIWSKLEIE